MMKREVKALIIGTDEERERPRLIEMYQQLAEICPSWDLRFLVSSTFQRATARTPEYPDIEVVHIVNVCDFNLDELRNGGSRLAPEIAQHPRKPLVSFELRIFNSVLHPIFAHHGLETMTGRLQDVIQYRWHQRAAPKLRLVS